jgi:hypothetical protein
VGGGSGVSAGASVGSTGANASITGNRGDLLSVNQNGGTTGATVNLGGALGALFNNPNDPGLTRALAGVDLSTALLTPGPRNSPAEQVRQSFESMSIANRRLARSRCAEILLDPGSYAVGVQTLCKLIARL